MLERYAPRLEFESYEDFYARFSVIVPENFNFAYDVADALAEESPDARALVWRDERGASAEFTFRDMKRLSDQTANALTAGGIKKGDPVMLILKRRWEFWPILLALHKIGAAAIPATHLLTQKDILYRCEAADIAGIIAVDDPQVLARVDAAAEQLEKNPETKGILRYKAFVRSVHSGETRGISGWTDFKAVLAETPPDFRRPPAVNCNEDCMLIYFTSGTTGMPKMVRHDFAYPLGHILTAYYWQRVQQGGLHLTVADTGWAKAAWGKIYGQWLCGSGVFAYDFDRFVPADLLKVIAENRITTFCAPPTVYRFFVKEDLRKYDFSGLKHCAVAGEPLNPEIYEQFKSATGIALREAYGQTELTVAMANFPWLTPKPGSMGKPSPGYEIDLIRDDGSSCDMGEEGQIIIRTDTQKPVGMFGGYYRDDALTKSVWRNGAYYTGDMAWRDEDGCYWFIGRADDVIKSSGYRIGPFEVESALLEHPAVLECAITGVPDPDRGAAVKATVVLAKGWSPSEALKKELQNHVKKTTAPYKYPRIVEFTEELPKTISGKIRRVQIREEHSSFF
ncbi:MAG: AMP-binding protein [Spirochaetaceae bacterium]|jgi:acetyl-CoA synthetase|nr:AMP-binding protein [Spirochaetaceae bacterium]